MRLFEAKSKGLGLQAAAAKFDEILQLKESKLDKELKEIVQK